MRFMGKPGALGFLCPLDESSETCAINSLSLLMDGETMMASVKVVQLVQVWLGLSPADVSYSSTPRDPLCIRLHGGLPLPYLFVLSGQTHGLFYSVELLFGLWRGGGDMRFRMSVPS